MTKELNNILEGVCRELKVDTEAVKGTNRASDLVNARRQYIHLAKKHTSGSLTDISKVIFRTHVMSLHHDKKHIEFMETDKEYARDAFTLEHKAVPQYMVEEDREADMIDRLLIRNGYLQTELLQLRHDLEISELRVKRLTLNN